MSMDMICIIYVSYLILFGSATNRSDAMAMRISEPTFSDSRHSGLAAVMVNFRY